MTTVHQNISALLYKPSEFVQHFIEGDENEFPNLNLNIDFKDFIKLSNQRSRFVYSFDHFIKGSQWTSREEIFAKAKLKYKGSGYKVKVKLFGLNNDHYRHPYKWSFRVKTKDFIKEFGNEKFNLLQPNTRMYITDPICNKVFEELGLINLQYIPVNLKINNSPRDLYFVEDFFSKYIIERNRKRESYIFTSIDINHPSDNKLSKEQEQEVEDLLCDISFNPEAIIDFQSFDILLALTFLSQNKHPFLEDNLHYYYNPVISKVEPTIREVWFEKQIRVTSEKELKEQLISFIKNPLMKSNSTLTNYFNILLQDEGKLDNVIKSIGIIANTIIQLRTTNEWKKFETDIYNRFPEAIYLCKNIELNTDAIQRLNLQKSYAKIISNGVHKITKDFVLKDNLNIYNTDLYISSGVSIDLNGFNIILNKGKLIAEGEKTAPIEILNNSKKSSSIVVLQSTGTSSLKNVSIHGICNYNNRYWHLPAGITFYESNVKIENSEFYANKAGDDFINIFRCSNFEIRNVSFNDIIADAIDTDFSNGIIADCTFSCIGNDAIDGSGSNLKITNSVFDEIQDKAISSGEGSDFIVSNSLIKKSELAFVAKDGSNLREVGNKLINNRLDYCLFNKKDEFYNGTLYTNNSLQDFNYLVEVTSRVFLCESLDTSLVVTENVKDKLYGNEFGKKSQK